MNFAVQEDRLLFFHAFTEHPENNSQYFSEHYHAYYELLYFISGDADFVVRGKRYGLVPGRLILTPPGEFHNIIFRSDAPYERYVLHFWAEDLFPALRERLSQAQSVYDVEGSPIAETFAALDAQLTPLPPELRQGICLGAMYFILTQLVSAGELARTADYVDEEVRHIVDYIGHNLARIRTADDLAAGLHRSKPALYKSFARQYNVPLMSYVRNQKCMAARALLLQGLPATEVAQRLGFSHYTSFYRDYRAVFGIPPSGIERAGK